MDETFHRAVSEAAYSLIELRVAGDAAYIHTPLTYLGGSSVVVKVDRHGDRFFVSDAGVGTREAELMGGAKAFSRIASGVAHRYGVKFDRVLFFEPDTMAEELAPVVMAVANASKTAVDFLSQRLAEKMASDARGQMQERLRAIFNPAHVATGFTVRGATNDEWEFDAAVKVDDRVTLFQVITPSPQSVFTAAAKFIDVSDIHLPSVRGLVGVLQDREKTPRLKLIQRSASIIDISASPDVWQRAAA